MSFAGLSLIGVAKETSRSDTTTAAAASPVMDSGYHLLLIQGYSHTKDTPNGHCILSQPFNVGGYSWFIKYYPNGYSKHPGYICFLLFLEEDNIEEPVMVQYEFSFIDQVEKQESSRIRAMQPRHFSSEVGWGSPLFMRRTDLERSKHLKNDSFMIRSDIVMVTASSSFLTVPPPHSIQQNLTSLLLSGDGADVTFKIGDETFLAHRCVLAARSPVFKAELFGPMKEGTTTSAIRIDDGAASVQVTA
ncbi:hypothetical protein PR202_gb06809 [Eleusine coracana subsp. coracana]|uniref:Uncharacterized protein n=1 Tax=Eleusine coracana subsp. coracana TaxID=191504 RepID=A0AAV5EAG9_ELECO|nr:hypothetical protein PR202_gb06809 [Eleusine coracana subsp. coracana]